MPSQKSYITYVLVGIVLYITSCLIEQDQIITNIEINECFHSFVESNNPKAYDVEERLLGEWTLKNSVDEETVLFNPDRRYFIFKNKAILETGTFKVIQQKNVFFIKTSKKNELVDGIINICTVNAFNLTTNSYWFRLCDCYI